MIRRDTRAASLAASGPTASVDLRKLRKLIKDFKVAPCFPGVDSESCELEDCPICFLKFPSLNRAVCCHQPICTVSPGQVFTGCSLP
ncbi:hypothetical protein WJX79_009920 [Trebouxia sp. C0005]